MQRVACGVFLLNGAALVRSRKAGQSSLAGGGDYGDEGRRRQVAAVAGADGSEGEHIRRRVMLLTLLVPAAAAVGVRLFTGAQPIDDAYITFRYARNVADGLGLVYNPGEWVLGTTAPLWALLLGAGYRLGFTDLPWLATILSALFDAGSAALLARLGLKLGWRPLGAALVGLAWAFNAMSVAFASGGMETSLFVLMSLVVLALAAQGRRLPVAAGLAGLATLVRPEGALLAATVVGWTWLRHRRQTPLTVVAAGLPIAAAGAAAWVVYGSPLPHSMAAKQVAYVPVGPFDNVVALLLHAGLPGWSTFLVSAELSLGKLLLVAALFGLLAQLELARRGLPWLRARRVAWQPFAVFGLLYLAFYTLAGLRGVRLFSWYLVPLEPVYLLALAGGLARLGWTRTPWLAAVLMVWQAPAIDWRQPFLPTGNTLTREHLLLDVGHDLASSLSPNAVVAAPEIGALGWASNLRILDTVGLVSPAALPYYPLPSEQLVTDNAIPSRLIDDSLPDAVVTLDAYAQRTLLQDPTFLKRYHLERSHPARVWLSRELLVFLRSDAVP